MQAKLTNQCRPIISTNRKYRRMVYVYIGNDAYLYYNPDYIKLLHNSIE